MSDESPASPTRPPPSVFLSYASEDRKAAQALRDALPAYGLEVWYDESGLDGGDAWDQKIRRQIRECDFFMPVISAQTEVRPEGYFRREWRLAVERTQDMADDHTFILPVVIDDTAQAGARVPEKFLAVQWMRVPGGQPSKALEARCRRLVAGEQAAPASSRRSPEQPAAVRAPAARRAFPEFPHEEPGQRIRFWAHIIGWACKTLWIAFQRLPKWVRILIYLWLAVLALSKGCTGHHAERLSSADADKIRAITSNYQGSLNRADLSKLGEQIAHEIAPQGKRAHSALIAIPFSAPPDDAAAQTIAAKTFAATYGRVAVSEHGAVDLAPDPLPSQAPADAAARGRAQHAQYVLYGGVDTKAQPQSLRIALVDVSDGSLVWSADYPVSQANPEQIAADVDAKVRDLSDDD
jgi:hypothetical protein